MVRARRERAGEVQLAPLAAAHQLAVVVGQRHALPSVPLRPASVVRRSVARPGEEDLAAQRAGSRSGRWRCPRRRRRRSGAVRGRARMRCGASAGQREQQIEGVPAVVDENAAAGQRGVAAPFAADARRAAGADGLEAHVRRPAERAVGEQGGERLNCSECFQLCTVQRVTPAARTAASDGAIVGERRGERLLAEDVAAAPGGADGERGVQRRRGGDVDDIEPLAPPAARARRRRARAAGQQLARRRRGAAGRDRRPRRCAKSSRARQAGRCPCSATLPKPSERRCAARLMRGSGRRARSRRTPRRGWPRRRAPRSRSAPAAG